MYARELGHHVEAGIAPWQVLRMATSGNAALMGLRKTGKIALGMEADLVFLSAYPVRGVRNVEDVDLVVTDGNAYHFDDLVALTQTFVK